MNNGPDITKADSDHGQPANLEPLRSHDADAPLEAALRYALGQEDAPVGFADRVMARALAGDRPVPLPAAAHQPGGGKVLHWPQSRLWITVAVAAGLIAGVFEGGLAWRHVQEQQRRIVQATQQFQTTERITVHALAQAREQLQRAGVPLTLD